MDFHRPATWNELVRQAQTILEGERTAHPLLRGYSGQFKQYEGLVCDMLEFVGSHNGSFLTDDGRRSNLTAPESLQAVRFVREQIIQQLATPAALTYQESESLAVFLQGNAVFHRNWPYAWGIGNDPRHSKIVGKIGVTTLPRFSEGRSTAALGGWLYGISAYSRNPDEAWAFIEFMAGPEMQKHFAIHASLAPSRLALYADPKVLHANPHSTRICFRFFKLPVRGPARPCTPLFRISFSVILVACWLFQRRIFREEAQEADWKINRFLALLRDS